MPVLKLDELNPPQREAVTTTEGPLLVLAGAGSGKTRVITYRVAHLLERGVDPKKVLAVSFTNKAADEMVERVERLVGARAARELTLSTFHSLGMNLLKIERQALGFPSGFTIYDASDQLGLVRELLRKVSIDDRKFDSKAILFRISRAKNAFVSPDEYQASVGDHEYDLIAADLYPKYQESLRAYHALDFDDLITEAVRLLDRDPEVRARWSKRFRYVMVDEYQDTNRAQFKLLEHLTGHGNVCVVGDDDQSIYGWRGAEAGHILEFDRHFPGAKIVKLEENYRSTPFILDAANAVIAHNTKRHPKRLWTARRTGDKLVRVTAEDAEAEARFVAEEIEVLCATRGYKPGQCAVLYRSNVQSRLLEEAMRNQRLSYRVVGGQSFFDRKEIKDAIAYLKLAIHPRDEISLRRVINYPSRGIGATTLEKLSATAQELGVPLAEACRATQHAAVQSFTALVERGRERLGKMGLAAAAREYIVETGLPDEVQAAAASPIQAQRRLENLEGFYDALGRFEAREGRDLGQFLHRMMLQSNDDDAETDRDDVVTLVTLHGAKGLEFPVVFLVGLEEELIPHRRTLYPNGPDVLDATIDLGEERRLMYVGITRARELLYLTHARSRSQRSSSRPRSPSRFLEEIPPELYDTREAAVAPAVPVEEKDAFARAALERMLKMTD